MTRIAFIGAGNMATALIRGLINAGHPVTDLCATDPHDASRSAMQALGVNSHDDNAAAVAWAEVVVIAVKPQVARDVLTPLQGQFDGKTLISICAGLPCAFFEGVLGDVAVVRAMPNTPALVGLGATGLFANGRVSAAGRDSAAALFNAGGLAAWVESEALIDAVTAASGSGPAYFFAMIEAMVQGAEALGLDTETATRLVCQTALGAAQMTLTGDASPGTLRERVTSKGGTTAAALERFEAGDFNATIQAGMQAAYDRAQVLAAQS